MKRIIQFIVPTFVMAIIWFVVFNLVSPVVCPLFSWGICEWLFAIPLSFVVTFIFTTGILNAYRKHKLSQPQTQMIYIPPEKHIFIVAILVAPILVMIGTFLIMEVSSLKHQAIMEEYWNAMETADWTYCDQKETPKAKTSCQWDIAFKSTDVENCNYIDNELSKQGCFIEFAWRNKDITLCERVLDRHNQCLVRVADATNDISICDNLITDARYKKECYSDIAKNLKIVEFRNGKVSTACNTDDDCIIANKELDYRSCWPGRCDLIDYSMDKWVGVNKESFEKYRQTQIQLQPSVEECGPLPGCPSSFKDTNMEVWCIQNACDKLNVIR